MDLSQLQELGGFVSSTPVKHEVTWSPPEGESVTFTVHIKRLSAGVVERLWSDPRKDRSSSAILIAEAVFLGDDGAQSVPYEMAFNMAPSLANALLEAIETVNPTRKRKAGIAKN